MLEKLAVKVGGATNHRHSLGDLILVKNNHVDAQTGAKPAVRMRAALKKIQEGRNFLIPLEVEVRNMEELTAALDFSPEAVLLDNMNDAQIEECVRFARSRQRELRIEVSGGVNPGRLSKLKAIGVDAASMGKLTTAARWVDISMRLSEESQ